MVTQEEALDGWDISVSESVKKEKWDFARDAMGNARRCFIGEKYMYSTFPDNERWNLETLASEVIRRHDREGYNALIELRESLAELLEVKVW